MTIVQTAWMEKHRPHLHGWVYDLRTGKLKELETLAGPGKSRPA